MAKFKVSLSCSSRAQLSGVRAFLYSSPGTQTQWPQTNNARSTVHARSPEPPCSGGVVVRRKPLGREKRGFGSHQMASCLTLFSGAFDFCR